VGGSADGQGWLIAVLDSASADARPERVSDTALPDRIRALEDQLAPRWTVRTLRSFYPPLLAAGIRLRRAHDLILCHAILRDTAALAPALPASALWLRAEDAGDTIVQPGLFDIDADAAARGGDFDEVLAQWRAQSDALERAPGSPLELLCAAESTGALIAEELTAAGLPWSRTIHEGILEDSLGPRPLRGARPAKMAALAAQISEHLHDTELNPDSPPRLLRALHRVGVFVESTSRWQLAEVDHPVVAPLLEYKKLSRLFTANGWAWLDDWVHDDRFRPVYLTGGVV